MRWSEVALPQTSSSDVSCGPCKWPGRCSAGRPEDEALAALRAISEAVAAHGRLQGLNLSDNALGEKGVRAFASGLQGQVFPPPLPPHSPAAPRQLHARCSVHSWACSAPVLSRCDQAAGTCGCLSEPGSELGP